MGHDARGQKGAGGQWSELLPVYAERMEWMAAHVAQGWAGDPGWRVIPPIQGGAQAMGLRYDPTQADGE